MRAIVRRKLLARQQHDRREPRTPRWDEPVFTIDELAAKYKISTRTALRRFGPHRLKGLGDVVRVPQSAVQQVIGEGI